MSPACRRYVAFLVLIALGVVPCMADDYAQLAGDAVSKIELGRCDQASSLIAEILARDENDLIGRTALAVAYLHTGRLSQSEREFQRLLSVTPDDWHARYALGLIALLRENDVEAKAQLARLDAVPEAREDLDALRGYLDFVNGKAAPVAAKNRRASPLSAQMEATAASRSGDRSRAISLLSDLTATDPPGFEEIRAPIATFEAARPIALQGGTFTWRPAKPRNVPTVSGTTTLYADTKKLSDVHFVSLYVDDKCAAITNYEPFKFDWDTTGTPNGLHHIRIEAKTNGGAAVTDKSVWVRVSNQGVSVTASPEVARLRERLWNCIHISGSRKLAHYRLAKLYLESNDRDSAITHLEATAALDPSFLDARKLLNDLRGWRPLYVEVRKGSPGSKMVALTFDDGPNERTAEMLDVLTKLNVPATFFLVGFRAQLQPELVKALASAGHEIENHSYTHTNLTTLSADQVEVELSRCAAAIHAITGKTTRYFRPPGGHANAAVKQAAARQGFTGIFWTVLCSPYEGAKYESLSESVIKGATDGAIILMHNGEPATTSALPEIVRVLRMRGYRFVTLSELLGSR